MAPAPIDPLDFAAAFWPGVSLYDKQRDVLASVRDTPETYVPAGHQLGKDFVAALCALWYFSCHHPVRVVTTSVKDDHLRVLWGELGRWIDTSSLPQDRARTGVLSHKRGGPLVVNHREVRKLHGGRVCKVSYLVGTVSERGEGMAGHHAAHTLLVVDEASGVDDLVYERGSTWAKRILVLGNPYPAGGNFFERAVKAGDLLAEG